MQWRANLRRLLEAHAEGTDDTTIERAILNATDAAVKSSQPLKKLQGSRPGRAANVNRDRLASDEQLFTDYFTADPVYGPGLFYRHFRMSRRVFDRLMETAVATDPYFEQKQDGAGLWGLSPRQKVTAALRIFCYGTVADSTDEYL